MYFSVSAIDDLTGLLGDADLLVTLDLETDTGRLTGGRVGDSDVGDVQRRFLVDDTAIRVGLRRTGMALHHIDALDDHAAFDGHDLGDGALAALVLAGQDDDAIALLNLSGHQITSGAREIIFMWFLARSS